MTRALLAIVLVTAACAPEVQPREVHTAVRAAEGSGPAQFPAAVRRTADGRATPVYYGEDPRRGPPERAMPIETTAASSGFSFEGVGGTDFADLEGYTPPGQESLPAGLRPMERVDDQPY